MSLILPVYTIGSGDLLVEVFNAVAAVFNNTAGILAVTHLAIMLGGFCAIFQFTKTRDLQALMRWAGLYVLITSLMLYPKATVEIVDRTDIKPRAIDNVPLSLAIFSSFTTRIGLGMAELVETVFHMPQDMSYNKTGMLMGSKYVLASQDFQITDPVFSETLDEFMQQCVFYDLLLNRYTVNDITHDKDPWKFIKDHTSVARAFPLNGQITICKTGAAQLDTMWQQELNNAAAVYGAQIIGNSSTAARTLLSRLSDGYSLLTSVSEQGAAILQKNMLANAMSQAVSHYSANTNAPAALQAFEDTKTELQIRHTLDLTGRQAGYWLQQIKNTLEAVLYGSFIFVYFLSYFPFGLAIIRNYIFGLFYLQTLAPMFAIVNFTATFYAENRSMLFSSDEGLSIANIGGITQANADAMALAGYLSWLVAIGGGVMLFRGLPAGLQSAAQYFGGVLQNATTHVAAEAVSGNMSVGNTSFSNQSQFNTNANHFDTNARHASGMVTMQTSAGSTVSVSPNGKEIMNTQGSLSNLPVDIRVAESIRSAASSQYQTSYTAGLSKMQAAGNHYSTALRQLDDFGRQSGHSENSGTGFSETKSSGLSKSAHEVSQLVDSFAKEHHVSHERAAQLLGQVYADAKVDGGFAAKFILPIKGEVGASASASGSIRSSFGSLYNEAERFSHDKNFAETVDTARRDAREAHYRVSDDAGNRASQSIARSFDEGDSFRKEASSSFSEAQSYSTMASQTTENASSINANYGQEFYHWMRTQPPIHRYAGMPNETLSSRDIDGMSISDMQKYADRFSQEKSAQSISSFSQEQHLNNGKSTVSHAYSQNNHSIHGMSDVTSKDHHYQEAVSNVVNHHSTGNVTNSMEHTVSKQMQDDEILHNSKMEADKSSGSRIENRATEKVKGKIFGSLNNPFSASKSDIKKITDTTQD
jgi:conjugal transfer mating pair stabilization protein TraG